MYMHKNEFYIPYYNECIAQRWEPDMKKNRSQTLLFMIGFIKKLFQVEKHEDSNIESYKEEQQYWKNKTFHIITIAMLTCGAILMFFGAYMYYSKGHAIIAISEICSYFIIASIITNKSLSINFRKVFISLALYTISIILLITTGAMGSGLVCILFSLLLTGCMLDKKQVIIIEIINIVLFIALTILLMNGYFDGELISSFKSVWYINIFTAQLFSIILLVLMDVMFSGLENQTIHIKKSEELLKASEIKHKAMIANISDVILIVDDKGIITYNSSNLKRNFAGLSEDIIDHSFFEQIYSEDQSLVRELFNNILQKDLLKKTIETRCIYLDGSIGYLELTAVNLMNDPNVKGILINYYDITERKIREDKILHLSHHDSLTGLYNRAFFETEKKRLDTESQLPLSFIAGDINGLKLINDSLGHVEGDFLLVTIAKILKESCRAEDVIARIGGDEFNILLPKTSFEVANTVIEKINAACKEYNSQISSELYFISISLGVATKYKDGDALENIYKIAEENMYRRKLLERRSLHSALISSMKTALFEKNQETEEHGNRLTKLTKIVGEVIGLTNQQFDELELFSSLHDIGKIGIEDQILNKPDKLTEVEWVKMKKHSEIGYRIAMSSPELMSIAYYILTHHEHWDGSGYPQGLSGTNIPLLSRILAVADAYDAMTEDRPYRKGISKQDAITEIKDNAGTQFDPDIARIFCEIVQA